jgi:hypothetical protein
LFRAYLKDTGAGWLFVDIADLMNGMKANSPVPPFGGSEEYGT